MTETVILTGATGLVGKNLAEKLSKGYRVIALTRKPVSISDVENILIPDFTVDLLRYSQSIPAGAVFIHCAAVINGSDEDYWQGNVEMTRRLLQLADAVNSRRFIYFSTGGVYGYKQDHYTVEFEAVCPIGIYGHTKYIGERAVEMYASEKHRQATILRLYFPFSDHQKTGLFNLIPNRLAAGEAFSLNLDGRPKMQPLHCDDIVEAVSLILKNSDSGSNCQIYNLCGNEVFSFKDLVLAYSESLALEPVFLETTQAVGDLLADNSKMKKDYGWVPGRSCRQFIQDSSKSFQSSEAKK